MTHRELVRSGEADRLVRELVAVTGESITDAARTAFAERLQRARARQVVDAGSIDARSDDEILGYDENVVPET